MVVKSRVRVMLFKNTVRAHTMREVFITRLVRIDRDPIRPLVVGIRARIARFIDDVAERVGGGCGFALDVLLAAA